MFKRSTNKKSPEIPTAALPDIIFILLFFFMVTVTPKPVEEMVDASIPTQERLRKFDIKDKIYITVGKPLNKALGTEPVIQFENEIITLAQIPRAVDNFRQTKMDAASRNKQLTVYLKGDSKLLVGLVSDIEDQLKSCGVYKVIYLSEKTSKS